MGPIRLKSKTPGWLEIHSSLLTSSEIQLFLFAGRWFYLSWGKIARKTSGKTMNGFFELKFLKAKNYWSQTQTYTEDFLGGSHQAQQSWWLSVQGGLSEGCSSVFRASGPPKTKAKCYVHCLEFVESLLQIQPGLVIWCWQLVPNTLNRSQNQLTRPFRA